MTSAARSVALGLAIGTVLLGCGAAVQPTWSKAGVDRPDAARDAADCERQARHDPTHGQEQGFFGFSVPHDDRVFETCMRARGYRPAA